MRKLYLILFLLLISCSDKSTSPLPDDYHFVRLIAWNSINSEIKKTIITDWKEAKVDIGFFSEKKCYQVKFNTTLDVLVGPLVICIDYHTNKVLGSFPGD